MGMSRVRIYSFSGQLRRDGWLGRLGILDHLFWILGRVSIDLLAHRIPCNAPEYYDDIPREHLKFTDVYSFGMLIFRVILGGINPFKITPFKSGDVDIEPRSQEFKKTPNFYHKWQ